MRFIIIFKYTSPDEFLKILILFKTVTFFKSKSVKISFFTFTKDLLNFTEQVDQDLVFQLEVFFEFLQEAD